jgi:hypothetical protein
MLYQQPQMNPYVPEYYHPGILNRQQQAQYYPPYPPRQRCRWIYCCDPIRPPYGGYDDYSPYGDSPGR